MTGFARALEVLDRMRGVDRTELPHRLLDILREETGSTNVVVLDAHAPARDGDFAVAARGASPGARIVFEREAPFDGDDAAFAELLAVEALSLLERNRSRDLALINDVGGLVARQLDLEALLQMVVDELARVIDVPRVVLSLADDSRTNLKTVACSQEGHPMLSVPIDGPGLVSLVYRTCEHVVVDDADADDRSHRVLHRAHGAKSVFVVPLIAHGQPIGTILLAETRKQRRFTEEEIARATAVANLVSPAIENAKMFADLRRSYDALSQAQADLVRHERLAALGELSAVIAHEVRNPLAVIFNSLGSLRKVAATNEEATVLLDIVGEEAGRLNRIVSDLLDFVRPYSSHPRPANLATLVAGAVEGARRSLASTATSIDLAVAPDSHELCLDSTMIQQALINLIVNAVQATPSGGRVTVRARTQGTDAPQLVFEVMDEGPGIDPADEARIFQPFFTTKPTGTGLGLAVVRRIADALGGRVDVTRGASRGAVFTFAVPHVAFKADS